MINNVKVFSGYQLYCNVGSKVFLSIHFKLSDMVYNEQNNIMRHIIIYSHLSIVSLFNDHYQHVGFVIFVVVSNQT